MSCTMYQQGKCLKQPVGLAGGLPLGPRATTFKDCPFDGRVWVGGQAVAGRQEGLGKRHEDCSMFEGNVSLEAREEAVVRALGDRIGYGRVMQLASDLWRARDSRGAITLGPCAGLTVPCGCTGGCDWCEGAGVLTQKVKQLKDITEPA